MKYIIPFFLLLPFMASGQNAAISITNDSIILEEIKRLESAMPRNPILKPGLTLQNIIDAISDDKESIFYQKTKNLCIFWYELEKKIGSTDEEAAISTFNMLLELMTDISKQ